MCLGGAELVAGAAMRPAGAKATTGRRAARSCAVAHAVGVPLLAGAGGATCRHGECAGVSGTRAFPTGDDGPVGTVGGAERDGGVGEWNGDGHRGGRCRPQLRGLPRVKVRRGLGWAAGLPTREATTPTTLPSPESAYSLLVPLPSRGRMRIAIETLYGRDLQAEIKVGGARLERATSCL